VNHPDSDALTVTDWTPWTIPLSDFMGVSAMSIKRLYIGVGDCQAPKAGGAGRLLIDDIQVRWADANEV